MAFNCVIVTPEQQVFDQMVTQVIFPAHDGKMGILTGRAPLLAKLGVGELRLTQSNNQQHRLFIEGGVVQMKDNKLTILTTEAMPVDEIDAESARAELAEATARKITDEKSYEDRQRSIERSRSKLQLVGQR